MEPDDWLDRFRLNKDRYSKYIPKSDWGGQSDWVQFPLPNHNIPFFDLTNNEPTNSGNPMIEDLINSIGNNAVETIENLIDSCKTVAMVREQLNKLTVEDSLLSSSVTIIGSKLTPDERNFESTTYEVRFITIDKKEHKHYYVEYYEL